MKKNYIVITEFSFAKNGTFEMQSLPKAFTTKKRALEFVEAFHTHMIGFRKISETSMLDKYGNRWDKVILVETGALTYYRIRVQGVCLNEY